MKSQFKKAWGQCRLLNWGTLHFSYSREVSEACRMAYESRKFTPATIRLRKRYREQGIKYQLP